LLPYQADDLDGFTVHTGRLWLSDPRSLYNCDGPGDDKVDLIVGGS
jgi:hypothetical protein